jgi:hypothetical protein
MRLLTALLLCLCVLTPGALFGQGKPYFELFLGSSSVEYVGAVGTSVVDSAYSYWGGYAFSSNFSVEAGIGVFGTDVFSEISFSTLNVGIKGMVPLDGGVFVQGKVGMASWDASVNGVFGNPIVSNEGEGIYIGVGASYIIDDIAYATIDYYGGNFGDYNVDVVSLGIGFMF